MPEKKNWMAHLQDHATKHLNKAVREEEEEEEEQQQQESEKTLVQHSGDETRAPKRGPGGGRRRLRWTRRSRRLRGPTSTLAELTMSPQQQQRREQQEKPFFDSDLDDEQQDNQQHAEQQQAPSRVLNANATVAEAEEEEEEEEEAGGRAEPAPERSPTPMVPAAEAAEAASATAELRARYDDLQRRYEVEKLQREALERKYAAAVNGSLELEAMRATIAVGNVDYVKGAVELAYSLVPPPMPGAVSGYRLIFSTVGRLNGPHRRFASAAAVARAAHRRAAARHSHAAALSAHLTLLGLRLGGSTHTREVASTCVTACTLTVSGLGLCDYVVELVPLGSNHEPLETLASQPPLQLNLSLDERPPAVCFDDGAVAIPEWDASGGGGFLLPMPPAPPAQPDAARRNDEDGCCYSCGERWCGATGSCYDAATTACPARARCPEGNCAPTRGATAHRVQLTARRAEDAYDLSEVRGRVDPFRRPTRETV